MHFFTGVSNRMLILWCYLTWYLVIVIHCFEKNSSLWGTAVGISVLVGIALNLSTGGFTKKRIMTTPWEVFRLFLVPFCVSSFSAIVKGKGYFLIVAPQLELNIKAILACFTVICLIMILRRLGD